MRRKDIFSLFVIAGLQPVELSDIDSFPAIPKRKFQMGQKVWANTRNLKCCGIIIGFLYLAPNEFTTHGWQYAIWVTDYGHGYPSPVEWFEPEELASMTLEDLEAATAPIS